MINENEVKTINENAIVTETEKAYKIKVNYVRLDGEEKVIAIWVPKSCTEITGIGVIKIKDWFRKNKEDELHGMITPYLEY